MIDLDPVDDDVINEAGRLLAGAASVIIVAGYGLARSRGHHALAALADTLRGEVGYVVHPVAGRLPGQLNLLLDEAGVDHRRLVDPADPVVADVALVVGADDVVNPSARTDPSSSLSGLATVDLSRVGRVVMITVAGGRGYAGVPNPLRAPPTLLLEGDATIILRALARRV